MPLAQIVPINRPNRMPNEEQSSNFRSHQREEKKSFDAYGTFFIVRVFV